MTPKIGDDTLSPLELCAGTPLTHKAEMEATPRSLTRGCMAVFEAWLDAMPARVGGRPIVANAPMRRVQLPLSGVPFPDNGRIVGTMEDWA